MERTELQAWLRLTLTSGVGNQTARRLLAAFGSAPAIFDQSAATLSQLGSDKLARAILATPERLAEQLALTLAWLEAADNRCIATLGDPQYPAGLLDIEDPPLMLYMRGAGVKQGPDATKDIAQQAASNLAIVGSRNPTPQGAENARQFARSFASSGLCVVSGLALGVDGAAHEGALDGGAALGCCTIAVVATGLDRVYPKQHLELAHRITERGLMISEFPLGSPPLSANFPKRNRIISGLSRGVLVVEAALKSGSLITARLAVEQGKDVFAIPGSIHSQQSRGCHALIKQGAKLVESAQDVLEELQYPAAPDRRPDDSAPDPSADSSFMTALGFDLVSLDALQARTGMATPELQARLLELEMEGQIARLPGGLFQRLARS